MAKEREDTLDRHVKNNELFTQLATTIDMTKQIIETYAYKEDNKMESIRIFQNISQILSDLFQDLMFLQDNYIVCPNQKDSRQKRLDLHP